MTFAVLRELFNIVQYPYRPTIDFHTRFDSALALGHDEALACVQQVLQETGTPNTFEPDDGGFSGLYWVCLRGHLRAAQWLLSQGAEPNGDNSGRLPGTLLAAVSSRSPEVVRLLIAAGADVNAQDAQYDTPLLKSVNYADGQLCELLLGARANPEVKNLAGVCALSTRLHVGQQHVFEELFSRHGYAPEFDIYERSGKERFEQWLAARQGTTSDRS